MKLVSIITPLYNSENYIEDTIISVVNQTYENWELIIVDDCSTDCSVDIVNRWCKKDNRIMLHKLHLNSGAAVCRNKGIDAAKGSFIAFLDSDDLWDKYKLEKQVLFMNKNGYAFTFTAFHKIFESGKLMNEVIQPPKILSYSNMLKKNYIGCLTVMYSVDSLGKIFMPLIRKRQDYAAWLKILKIESKAYCLSEPLAYYRVKKNSISSNKIEMIKYNWELYRKIEKLSLLKSIRSLFYVIILKILKK